MFYENDLVEVLERRKGKTQNTKTPISNATSRINLILNRI